MKYDTIVIGAGSMGMAAGYYLAKKKQKVLLLDSFNPPHRNGSHHGETRIIRHAYGEGEYYVPLALRAQELWNELEKVANEKLFLQTGVINIGKKESFFIQEVITSAKKYNLPLEILDSDQINKRWPFRLSDEFVGCLETNSGVLYSEKCILAYRNLAENLGASLLTNTEVIGLKLDEGWVEVHTSKNKYEANHLIVTAGAWTKQLLQMINIDVPLSILRKTFAWFHTEDDSFHPDTFPAFTMDLNEGIYYGFPNIDEAGLKIGRHDGGQTIHRLEDPRPEFGAFAEDEKDVSIVLHNYFKKVRSLKEGKTCMYSMTPDENFIIDKLPGFANVAIACGFSGHGFKFSSVVGEILSKMAMDEKIDFDLTPFSLKRFLSEE
jgi:N-methyl-L-tryptophan oxidase